MAPERYANPSMDDPWIKIQTSNWNIGVSVTFISFQIEQRKCVIWNDDMCQWWLGHRWLHHSPD
jgi:hypothetical protein